LLRPDIILFLKSLAHNMTLFVDKMLLLLRGLLKTVVDLGQNLKLVVQLFFFQLLLAFFVGKLLNKKLLLIHAGSFGIAVNIFVKDAHTLAVPRLKFLF